MKYLILILSAISLASCQFELPEVDESAAAVPMEELNVPADFEFNTARTVQLAVSAKDAQGNLMHNVPFKVLAPDGESFIELQTASTGTSGIANLELALPFAAGDLLITTPYLGLPPVKLITVGTSSQLEVLLGDENREGFAGDLEDTNFILGNESNAATATVTSTETVGTRGGINFHYMGNYNSNGRPSYLVSPNDIISQDLLKVVNASLPEGYPVPDYHPEYLENDLISNVNLIEDAEVWVTFVHEGAGYRNALGYYSYPTNKPPKSVDEIDRFEIIFPNVSYNGSGGQLTTGNKVYLGKFEKGTSVGWFLVPDGWNENKRKVDVKEGIKFSDKDLNTFTDDKYRQHIALLYDLSLQKLIIGMEDIDRPDGDNDFNDAVFYVSANPFKAIQTEKLVAAINTDDTDEDGVSNSVDVEPNNPNIAFHAYTPAQGIYGTLAFEDLYPSQGDYDMNDLVVDYNFKEYLNSKNEIVKIDASLKLRASGGVQQNGFGFELGITPDKVASVTGYQLTNPSEFLASNGVETQQSKAVVLAFDNALKLLGGGNLINTEPDKTPVSPIDINMTVVLKQPVTRQELGAAPFNPFMFTGLRGKEVHLPGYQPTSRANAAFFGSADDATDPNAGIFYKTKTGLPYAINIPVSFTYPAERVPVNTGHLKFTQWAQSGGSQFADWYKNLNGYRATQKLYDK